MKTITLAFTGASGLPYGMRLLECMLKSGLRVHLVYSQAAQIVARKRGKCCSNAWAPAAAS
jgi:4-hydroxy-3-polyprenylbenzoate decarboxylase